jgi:hypothetical protein
MSARTVAFLDILGFRQMVESLSTEQLGSTFTSVVGQILPSMNRSRNHEFPKELTFFPQHSPGKSWCLNHTFSDSIILISHDNSENSSLALLLYALRTMQTLIAFRLPVRGAVTYGEMYVDTANALFLGKALTQAYELEQRQNWIGVAIDESVPGAFPALLLSEIPLPGLRSSLFPKYDVPMKSGPIRSMHTLNWRWNLVATKGTKSLFDDGNDWSAKVKIQAALSYALEMRQTGRAYPLTQNIVPVEVRPFYIADGPPTPQPPRHGDEY